MINIDDIINNTTIYCVYHKSEIIDEYNLYNLPSYIKLLNINNTNLSKENINNLNPYLCELVAYYYIWKNKIYSPYVGFCHYRRMYKNKELFNNLYNYGCHYYGYIEIKIKDYNDNTLINENNHINKLYDFLKSSNKFNDNYLYDYFYGDNILNVPFKESYILNWNTFNNACKLIFGFLEYIHPNYKETCKYFGRRYAWQFEIYFGIIVALLMNNIKLEYTNWQSWDPQGKQALFLECENKNQIIKWIHKNLKTNTKLYIKTNLDYKDINEPCTCFIKDTNEIKECYDIITLKCNEYIDCLDPIAFDENNYTIKTFNN